MMKYLAMALIVPVLTGGVFVGFSNIEYDIKISNKTTLANPPANILKAMPKNLVN